MKELLQQALDALLEFCDGSDAIDALRAAIAQPDELSTRDRASYQAGHNAGVAHHKKAIAQPAYVPLSDEGIDELADKYTGNFPTGGLNYNKFARAIERAVRGEK